MKPVVDIFVFSFKLGEAIGTEAPLYMIGYFVSGATFLGLISPPFPDFTATEKQLECAFQYSHSRVISHSEEIAFYDGGKKELQNLNASFGRILQQLCKTSFYRFFNGIVDSCLVKYYATMLAYYFLGRPVFDPDYATELMGRSQDETQLMEDYNRNSSYLINQSQAIGRLLSSRKDLSRLSGYTDKVFGFLEVMEQVSKGIFVDESNKHQSFDNALKTVGQVVYKDGIIEFENVPLITPSGEILVKALDFTVKTGMNCLVTGPNGSGKSSLFRVLGNLWPLHDGKIIKPDGKDLFYVPQKPYVTFGTLRDQVIYPDSVQDALKRGMTDGVLYQLLEKVHLGYLVAREGGWESIQDWSNVLSRGEKQRVAMARLFYHKPQFAILDECTSAVSIDVEGSIYSYAKELAITLFTVSQRPSLFKYHEHLLRFDGRGGYDFIPLDPSTTNPFEFARNEIEQLNSVNQESGSE